MNKRLKTLENTISKVAGKQTEITIIKENYFSFFFEGEDEKACKKIVDFFLSANKKIDYDYDYDEECEGSCVYITIK